MFIDVGARVSWDGAIDRLAGAASKILPSSNLLHKAVNFKILKLIKLIAKKINYSLSSIRQNYNFDMLATI